MSSRGCENENEDLLETIWNANVFLGFASEVNNDYDSSRKTMKDWLEGNRKLGFYCASVWKGQTRQASRQIFSQCSAIFVNHLLLKITCHKVEWMLKKVAPMDDVAFKEMTQLFRDTLFLKYTSNAHYRHSNKITKAFWWKQVSFISDLVFLLEKNQSSLQSFAAGEICFRKKR